MILVNTFRKIAFWSDKSYHSGYIEYTIDKLLDALKFVIFETYILFGGNIFRQVKGIPMGGNASPLIADLYLSWCEYIYIKNLTRTDINLAKQLNHISRYLDDIAVVNYRLFLDLAASIYHHTLKLESNDHDHTWDTFLDLFIRIVRDKFLVGIYHKVDDFNFDVINFPFPESNIHSSLGYKTFYAQLVRFFRLCNNLADFSYRGKLTYSKLVGRGYEHNSLHKAFRRFTLKYSVGVRYDVPDFWSLWNKIINFKG